MKNTIVILAVSLMVIGCASVSKISEKDGKDLFQSKCRTSTADCHRLASETCSGKYDMIETTTHIVDHYMVFTCK